MENIAFYGVFAAIISSLVGIVAYFADKWLSHVDDSIKEVRSDVGNVSLDIKSLNREINVLKESYIDQALDLKKQLTKIDAKLEHQADKIDVVTIRMDQADRHLENYGKVIKIVVDKIKKT